MNEAKRMRYASATFGSLAYDFQRTEAPEIDYEEAPVKKPKRRVEERVKVESERKAKAATKVKTGVSFFTIVGIMGAAAMLVLVLMGYVHLTKVSAETNAIQRKITELKTTEAKLKVKYESTFDLTKVEEYAVARLGMVPATSSQVIYLNSSLPDKAEIITDKGNSGMLSNLTSFLSRVVEYFK